MSENKRPRLDYPTIAPSINDQPVTDAPASSDHRRRSSSSKTEGKRRFACTYAGCDRDYSRAEHLYRHQLNHNPKEIYKCDYPGCHRTFVRQDLCIRHRERHEVRGPMPKAHDPHREPLSPRSSFSEEPAMSPTSPPLNIFATPKPGPENLQSPPQKPSSFSGEPALKPTDLQAIIQQNAPETNGTSDQATSQAFHSAAPLRHDLNAILHHPVQSRTFSQTDLSSDSSLTARGPQGMPDNVFDNLDPSILSKTRTHSSSSRIPTTTDPQMSDRSSATYNMPTLGDQTFNDSPVSVRDEFAAWLFEDAGGFHTAPFSMGAQGGIGFANGAEIFGSAMYSNYFADPALDNSYPGLSQQRPVEATSKVPESSVDSNILSHAKRASLISLMERFHEGDNPLVRQLREEIFQGNPDAEEHVLSIRSMQHYIGSYWYHFHAQMPILHQPTFSADDTHEYLLLAVMAIGAAFLNKAHGRAVTDAAARFATFIAWHLRWQVFMHSDFHPPAKLWIFQTLLLLEVYEKMNATRMLHERAHIHYATTINLMRRGTALIETANQDSSRVPSSPEEWWGRWITAEATRRAAYAAFYLDALHAAMFGHAAMMVVHEIRLPLPCDDALWSATSAAEVGRVEASLHANGIKPTTFLDGLKKTLTGRKVRTNNFGRMILMAGLLSVSWHMNQRDLQVSSLGVSQTMGVPDGWRTPLTKAFDFWKKDFDESLEHMRRATLPWQKNDSVSGQDDMAQTAEILHHLSHMAMHTDVMDCQIFAGIKRLFGRVVTNADYERVKCKLFDWAKGPSARVAVYHALQLLRSVILPGKGGSRKLYNARDDYLMMRPWILYFAALVVWSYGFALDGVLRPFPSLLQPDSSPGAASARSHGSNQSTLLNMAHDGSEFQVEAVVKDAHAFLQTVGAVRSPQQLESIKDGRNNVVGVLAILETAFRDSRWELLHEAADLLRNAIVLLRGASRP
ncbi:uncharacterized protein Z520_01230 [Fonsecaea multimorphosa CBS 102226]|uniref:C2H2-type domain-containing protein n=1 Tax=Fonsecaea multimorphosa CBS 102226 TaxID=1442371 RepID=A0A0D2KH11_9EURO|nr:uncharacterized protein Z520_01230 [Fonsecaea multimorphosa CBS 102226]KIY02765.1 hypothetical protein Z520_01230 [Fonsecaea multimorphosa CBS 102226]OAL31188.1 hypothetical protein AYO22_01221 [Fonsecaea multimorphosa]